MDRSCLEDQMIVLNRGFEGRANPIADLRPVSI
jgi:hypothetical protein